MKMVDTMVNVANLKLNMCLVSSEECICMVCLAKWVRFGATCLSDDLIYFLAFHFLLALFGSSL